MNPIQQLEQKILKINLELKESSMRVDRQIQEIGEQIKKNSEEARLEMREARLETKKIKLGMEETRQVMQETDRRLASVGIQVGNMGNNQGNTTEEYFYNSLKAKPYLGGIKYDFIDKNVTRSNNNIEDEYDILLINGKDVAIIEVKHKAHISDIHRLITKKYDNFKKLYTEYSSYNHHLALASFYISKEVKQEASKHNIIILQRKGDIIETILPINKI